MDMYFSIFDCLYIQNNKLNIEFNQLNTEKRLFVNRDNSISSS